MPGAKAIVFAADGAGNFQAASQSLRKTVRDDALPIEVVTFDWSHGNNRIIADQTDYCWAREKGRALADMIEDYKRDHPKTPIYLVGHSAGAMVAIAAVEDLPPGTIAKAILLAPSLSSQYDLRPALARVAESIEVFYSRRDVPYLVCALRLFGTTDGKPLPAGGLVGFVSRVESEEDIVLNGKLHQRPWVPDDMRAGHTGGHYGAYAPNFLRWNVLPLIRASGQKS